MATSSSASAAGMLLAAAIGLSPRASRNRRGDKSSPRPTNSRTGIPRTTCAYNTGSNDEPNNRSHMTGTTSEVSPQPNEPNNLRLPNLVVGSVAVTVPSLLLLLF